MKPEKIKHLLIAPPLIFYVGLSLIPLILTVYFSFTNMNINGSGSYNGLTNYKLLINDSTFLGSYKNTILYVIIGVPIQYALGLWLALLVHGAVRGQRLMRLVIPIPLMIAPLIIGFIWKTMLDSRFGPINDFLSIFGIESIPWIIKPGLAFFSILVVDTWQWVPFIFLILYAGLRTLPVEPFEAARVDGASNWRIFYDITLPMLFPASVAAILLRSLEAFKIFDIVFYITGGGPGYATSSLSMVAYFTGLRSGNLGYAGAMTLVLLVTVIIFSFIFLTVMKKPFSRRKQLLKLAMKQVQKNPEK